MESGRDAHEYKGQYAEMKERSSPDYEDSMTVGLVSFFRKEVCIICEAMCNLSKVLTDIVCEADDENSPAL